MKKVEKGLYSVTRDEFNEISTEAKNLIKRMLEYAPDKRISASDAINDIWIRNVVKKGGEGESLIGQQALNNLKKLTYKSKLQQIVYYFIVNHMTTKDEKNELTKIFKALDKNNDGKLTKEELQDGYEMVGITDIEMDALMQKLDNDGSGSIDYTEFIAAAIDKEKVLTKNRIQSCFQMFDKDKSGQISTTELKDLLGGSENISEKVWKDLIREVDSNDDGEIGFEEFKEMLLKLV